MSDTTHQGYANYETFAVAVRIDNDQGLQATARGIADEVMSGGGEPTGDNDPGLVAMRVADRLQMWHEDSMPELDSPWSELLRAGWGAVDWLELADQYIAEVKEEQ